MLGLVFDDGLKLEPDLPVPRPIDGEALIQVQLAGVCRTDLEITKGYMEFKGVLGHEFVGRVVESPRPELIGQRVVGEINAVCGRCALCRKGKPHHCLDRTVLGIAGRDGVFAEYATLPFANLHRVPDGVTDRTAVFCEPLAAAYQILEQIEVLPGARVLVLGDGKLGLLVAQVLALTGADLLVLGHHEHKLRLLSGWGIPASTDPASIPGGSFEVVVDCTGSPEGLPLALTMVEPRGVIVLKTTVAGATTLPLAPIVIDEVTVVGSRCGPFEPALAALEQGSIQVEPLIDGCYPLTEGVRAVERAAERGALKVLIECGRD